MALRFFIGETMMNDAVEICRKLIRFKTDGEHLSEAFAFVEAELAPLGFECEILPLQNDAGEETLAFSAVFGRGEPHLLFVGHIDVVPAGNVASWKFSPFEAAIDEGLLYGRGSSDMLGGLAAFIAAVKRQIKAGKVTGRLSMILSGDEENIIVGGAEKLLQFAAGRGEKFDFCLVGEPSNPQKLGEQIKIGRRGDVFIRIVSTGYQGHTAYPHLAVNPVHNLVALLEKIRNLTLDRGNKFFEPSGIQITTFDVGNPAMNVIPARAAAAVDIRFNNEHTAEGIVRTIERLAEDSEGEFKIEAQTVGEAFLTPVTAPCEMLRKIIFRHTGIMPEYSTSGGTSDARFVKDYCPVLEFGLTSASIHKVDECASVSDIERLSLIYEDFIAGFFA